MPISTTSTSLHQLRLHARSGGSVVPLFAYGPWAPAASFNSASVSGATSISPGGVMNFCNSPRA